MGEVISFPDRRRRHARVPIMQPVALVHQNATVATTLGTNISLGGLQTVCDRYTSDSLHASGTVLRRHTAPRLDAHFRLPVATGLVKLDAECRMVYVARIGDGRYAIGLEFLALDERSRRNLDCFLAEAEFIASSR